MSNYLITGTSKGLGLYLVKELLKRPASSVGLIFATTRSAPTPALQKTIDESSGRVVNIIVNPVDLESVRAALSEVEKHLSGAGLDVLINNVGAGPYTYGMKNMYVWLPIPGTRSNSSTITDIYNILTVVNQG